MSSPLPERQFKANISTGKPEKDLELIQRIGSGTYGEVYKARLKATGELAAVKIIHCEPGDDFDIIQQEICIMQDCRHPNIVQYFGSYLRKDKLWIAMEYCGGGSLQDIYHVTGPLTEPMIGSVCAEMLKGLDYMHTQGKIHRDIKGANILLTTDGDVKLADFGVGAQITATMSKRNSFIGTPYWMAPEVAAVERTGGYDQMCDIWAVGITAIECAECQPPLFDLHPMRALYLISKRNYTPPTLKDKTKWTNHMRDFLKLALTRNPKKRPPAKALVQHPFCQGRAVRKVLSELIDKYELLRQQKKRNRVKEEGNGEDENQNEPAEENQDSIATKKRIRSKKDKLRKDRVQVPDENSQPVKKETEPERKEYHDISDNPELVATFVEKNVKRGDASPLLRAPVKDSGASSDSTMKVSKELVPDREPQAEAAESSRDQAKEPPRKQLPPSPPPVASAGDANFFAPSVPAKEPVPPRAHPATAEESEAPPLPPRKPNTSLRPNSLSGQKSAANCFSKIFNECPLTIFCATSWTHPQSRNHHLIFASDEGIYSLNLDDLQNIEMVQIYGRPCKWVYVIKNILVSISGSPPHVFMHNLVSLHSEKTLEQFITVPKGITNTTRVPGTQHVRKCCVVHNPYNNQMYLFVGLKEGILLLQWYEPLQKFMIVRNFECSLPPSLNLFEAIVIKGSEYPVLCVGAYHGTHGSVIFDKLDLETGSNWEPKKGVQPIDVKSFSQLQKDLILLAYDNKVTFVDMNGVRTVFPGNVTELEFDTPVNAAVCLPGSVLTFNDHGIQGKSLATNQVTAQFQDMSRVYRLLGSDRIVVIENRVPHEKLANLFILASS